jgi:GrpB-like predicted nucleotidyltransferase (UPF0157 family)
MLVSGSDGDIMVHQRAEVCEGDYARTKIATAATFRSKAALKNMSMEGDAPMKHLIALAVALLVGLAAFPSLPIAQVSEDDAQNAQSAIVFAGSRAARVAAIRDVPDVGVVNLNARRGFRSGDSVPEPEEFRISAAKNAAGIRRMRAALRANPVTRRELAERGISVNAVVGVNVSSSGSLRLYVLR